MKAYRGKRFIPPLILNLGMGCKLVESLKPQSLCPLIRKLAGSRGCLDLEAV